MTRFVAMAFALSLIASAATAQTCGTLPYQLTNGQTADATQVMANFDALLNCVTPAPGTTGQFLQTQGTGSNPQWASVKKITSIIWCGTCTVAADTLPVMVPPFGGTIQSITFLTNGSSTPSFVANVTIGGASMTGCNNVTVNSSTATTTACTGSNTFGQNQQINLIVSSVSGNPTDALVQINYTVP